MSVLPKKILLATDGSDDAALATRAAVDLSKRTGAELHVAHAWFRPPPSAAYLDVRTKDFDSVYEQHAHDLLSGEVRRIEALGLAVHPHLRMGTPIDEVLDLAEEVDAGLVVVGSRGLGPVRRLLLGSVSEGIVHHSTRPVLVARGGEEAWPPRRVVVGDDSSEDATAAARLAAGIAALYGAGGMLVRAYPEMPTPSLLSGGERDVYSSAVEDLLQREEAAVEERAGELEKVLGSRPGIKVAAGDAAAVILAAASEEESTLIAVGSRGLGPIGRMRLGSVSTRVLRAAHGPVLVYPHARE